ncbi:hypothetical protein ACET3X_008572 [Alternaria dauci]|uniref:MaoC-like domain-containing protein n=1 Tax=Alternaria dauci TaxID=48095 RepID=A0ABR3UAT1_9PLEO
MVGTEHIKQARLHGEGDTAKIFVTIERRFATLDSIERGHERGEHGTRPLGARLKHKNVQRYLQWQVRAQDNDGWGHALFKEERNLVFFKERTAAELEAVKAGQMATVKYLDPPGKPDFSHTLTPTRALLFRFSALTFNAHLIHLDPDYARNVEGHRNLLVHGPLSLILMLKTMNHYVHTQTEGKQALESIEYRNLAPLYCDEEMRICCSEKKKLENGSIYDVWIEGPTGGVAVKGTLRTTEKDSESTDKQETQGHSFKRPQHPALRYKMIKTREEARKMAKSSEDNTQGHVASEDQQSSTSHESSAIPEPSTSSEPSSQNQEK